MSEKRRTPNVQRPTPKYFARAARFGVRRLDAAFQFTLGNQSDAVVPYPLEKITVKLSIVIPSEVEEPRRAILRYRFGIPRLRFASLGMTMIANASPLHRFNLSTTP